MLGFFRTNQITANFLLILYVVLVRSAIFIFPQDWEPVSSGLFSDGVYRLVGASGLWPAVLAAVLVFVQAVLVNSLVAKFRIANEITYFPGVFYVLLSSSIPEFHYLSPALMANTFYILAFYELFHTYKKLSAASWLFNLGLWLSIASLFYFSYIIFILFALIGVGVLRAFRLKEQIMILCGYAVPYYLTWVYYFWIEDLGTFYTSFSGQIGMLTFAEGSNWGIFIKLAFIGVFLLIAITSFGIYKQKKNIQVQKYISILFWALLVSALSLFFQEKIALEHLLILTPPLGILISFNFLHFENRQIAEAVHLMLLLLAFVFQFYPFVMG